MVNVLQSKQCVPPDPKQIIFRASKAWQHNLEDFVTSCTSGLLSSLHIGCNFLCLDPETWGDRDDYRQAITIVNKLLVTNGNPERGVAVVQELNKLITHDEDQFQFLLQFVADPRHRYPDCLKSMLLEQTV